jgi:hypothetical protein
MGVAGLVKRQKPAVPHAFSRQSFIPSLPTAARPLIDHLRRLVRVLSVIVGISRLFLGVRLRIEPSRCFFKLPFLKFRAALRLRPAALVLLSLIRHISPFSFRISGTSFLKLFKRTRRDPCNKV